MGFHSLQKILGCFQVNYWNIPLFFADFQNVFTIGKVITQVLVIPQFLYITGFKRTHGIEEAITH